MERTNDMLQSIPQEVQLIISREFDAPRALVFTAYAKAEHLAKWWGPKGANVTIKEFDFRPGGRFLYSMPGPDGNLWWGMFEYNDIQPPELLTFISSFADEEGNVIRAPFSEDFPMRIYNHLEFVDTNGKTIINIKGGPINGTEKELNFFKGMHSSMQQGFAGTFDKLEDYLASISKSV